MGALPRPDLAPGPQRALVDALHDLHHRAGWPSLRTLARDAGCSHTTVSNALSSPKLPAWGIVEVLVESMAGDVSAFHDLWLAASTPSVSGTGPAPRIAGRRAELSAVRRHLETGTGLLLVTGEAGMGKTKLVTSARAITDTFVATGACLPLSSAVPFLPMTDVLREVHEADNGQWLKEALTGAAPYVTTSLSRLLPELDTVDALPREPENEWTRQRLFAAVGTALTGLAALRPLALLIEDLHWADHATLDLLEHLVTRHRRLSVIGTWRTDDPATPLESVEWSSRVRRAASVSALELAPLSRDETAAQLALLTAEPPSGDLVDRIHARSQGQPLYTEQLAAQADDNQAFPVLLSDLLDRRLDGLTVEAWTVARALGIADRELTDAQLRKVTELESGHLVEGLRELAGRRLLAGPGLAVGLRHPLLAEAVRRRSVLVESVETHRRIASSMAAWDGVSAAEVATHWQGAQEPERELLWRILAARQASARFASAQEAEQWQRAISLWGEEQTRSRYGVTLCDVYCSASKALEASGHSDAAADLMEEAAERLRDIDGIEKAQLLATLGKTRGFSDTAAGMRILEEALEVHRYLPVTRGKVELLFEVANHLRHSGRGAEAMPLVAEAVELSAHAGYADLERRGLVTQGWEEMMRGDSAIAWDHIEAARRVRGIDPDPTGDIWFGVVVTDALIKTSAPADDVEAAAVEGLRAIDEWGIDTYYSTLLVANLAEAWCHAGQPSRVADRIASLTPGPARHDRFWLYLLRAFIEMLAGNLDTARSGFEELHKMPLSSLPNRTEVAYFASECLLWCGDAALARQQLAELLEHALPSELATFQAGPMSRLARAAADLGEDSWTTRLRDLRSSALTDPFQPGQGPADGHAHCLTWTAEIARLARTQTVEMWVRAAKEWDSLTRPHDAAYCRWRAAQVAMSDGHGTLAARLLKRAAADAREHVPLLAEIRRLAG